MRYLRWNLLDNPQLRYHRPRSTSGDAGDHFDALMVLGKRPT
jgi:hypothetical protein